MTTRYRLGSQYGTRIGDRFGDLGLRSKARGEHMMQRWQSYFVASMINPDGSPAEKARYAYTVHLALMACSECICRAIISFVFVLAMASYNAGVIPATLAVLAKASAFGGCFMIMGNVSSYARLENLIAAWFPSSARMFSNRSAQPYADAIHVIVAAIFMYGGSLLGTALALSVSNKATANLGLPATTANVLGLFGNFNLDTSQIWLTEIYGSTLLTFAFLMAYVYRNGVRHNVYGGLVMVVVFVLAAGASIAATGANFDFIHYAAVMTVIAGSGSVNRSHLAAYLVAPLAGMAIAWVVYVVVSGLSFLGGYTRPGAPSSSSTYSSSSSTTGSISRRKDLL